MTFAAWPRAGLITGPAVTIAVTDSTGTCTTESGSIVIGSAAPPPPLQIIAPGAGTPDDVGTVGQSFLETLEPAAARTPTPGPSPGCLRACRSPRPSEESEISGTPTTAGTYPITITVTDSTDTHTSETPGIIIQS